MLKSLDTKLARITGGTATARDFILADAKDADMAFGLVAPGARTPAHVHLVSPPYHGW